MLKKTMIENLNNVIIDNRNINSLPETLSDLKVLVTGMLDILIILETRLDNEFPFSQFHIEGYSNPCRLDRNRNKGGIIGYVREHIPSRMVEC